MWNEMVDKIVLFFKTNLAKACWNQISQITRGKVLVSAFSRLRISKFVVHQARAPWSSQIIPQKYCKNQIELDHNFVVYEAFQILTQENKERGKFTDLLKI